jgi:hypothetical protein
MVALPRIMTEGKTPEQWKVSLADLGIEISERTLRERARALGACKMLGKAMILLPEHIDAIFEEPSCLSNSTPAKASIGSVDELLILASTSEEALEHLTRTSQRRKSGPSKPRRGNVVSLAQMRQN